MRRRIFSYFFLLSFVALQNECLRNVHYCPNCFDHHHQASNTLEMQMLVHPPPPPPPLHQQLHQTSQQQPRRVAPPQYRPIIAAYHPRVNSRQQPFFSRNADHLLDDSPTPPPPPPSPPPQYIPPQLPPSFVRVPQQAVRQRLPVPYWSLPVSSPTLPPMPPATTRLTPPPTPPSTTTTITTTTTTTTTTPAPEVELDYDYPLPAPTEAPVMVMPATTPKPNYRPRPVSVRTPFASRNYKPPQSNQFRSNRTLLPKTSISVSPVPIPLSEVSGIRNAIGNNIERLNDEPNGRSIGPRGRRGRHRKRMRSTTTTTTVEPPAYDEYDYYDYDPEYDDYDYQVTTTTTTTTSRPRGRHRGRGRGRGGRRRFQRPTEPPTTTTTTTLSPNYKPRPDGRIIDYHADPNFPYELKGADLTNYPFYISIPESNFNCKGRHDGYYADIELSCQVYHHCAIGHQRYDFLCPNYTLFDQTTFTCRFVNTVDCEGSENHYKRNNELYVESTTTGPSEPKAQASSQVKLVHLPPLASLPDADDDEHDIHRIPKEI